MKLIMPMPPEEALSYIETIHHSFGRSIGKTLQIRFIGAARNALERMVAEKPKKVYVHSYKCPTCNLIILNELVGLQHCCHCGQRLDWSDVNGTKV